MAGQGRQQQSSTINSISQNNFSEAVSDINNSTNVQSPPSSTSSSRPQPRQQLRFRDEKTLVRLMGRLIEEG
ncbi:hypothetical protein KY284_031027 [Solanum tuberosum]|nr:hypothetical protein KY284_031027 [Solanum tuberosum]